MGSLVEYNFASLCIHASHYPLVLVSPWDASIRIVLFLYVSYGGEFLYRVASYFVASRRFAPGIVFRRVTFFFFRLATSRIVLCRVMAHQTNELTCMAFALNSPLPLLCQSLAKL